MATDVLFSKLLLYFVVLYGTVGGESNRPMLNIQWYQFSCIGGDRALLSTGILAVFGSITTLLCQNCNIMKELVLEISLV